MDEMLLKLDRLLSDYIGRHGALCKHGHAIIIHGFVVKSDDRLRCAACRKAAWRRYETKRKARRATT